MLACMGCDSSENPMIMVFLVSKKEKKMIMVSSFVVVGLWRSKATDKVIKGILEEANLMRHRQDVLYAKAERPQLARVPRTPTYPWKVENQS